MSDTPVIPKTRREIDIARTAYVADMQPSSVKECLAPGGLCAVCRSVLAKLNKEAAERYPYPKTTRPRVCQRTGARICARCSTCLTTPTEEVEVSE